MNDHNDLYLQLIHFVRIFFGKKEEVEQKPSREERFKALEAKRRAKEGLPAKKDIQPRTQTRTPRRTRTRTSSWAPSRLNSLTSGSPVVPVPGPSQAALFDFMDDDFGEYLPCWL